MKTIKFLIFIMVIIFITISPLFSVIYGSVSGIITDEDTGKGVSGQYISVNGRLNLSAITDKDGKYIIESLIPGEYSIYVGPGYPYCSMSHDGIIIEPGKNTLFNGTVKLAGTIRGRVIMSDTQKPFPGVSIMAWGRMAGRADDKTGEDGTYFLGIDNGRMCPSSNYYIKAQCDDPHIAYKYILGVNVEKGNETKVPDIVFNLNDSTGIEGCITSSLDGYPLNGIEIVVHSMEKKIPGENIYLEVAKTITDKSGRYYINNLESGKYIIFILPELTEEYSNEQYESLCKEIQNINVLAGKKTILNVNLDIKPSNNLVIGD